MIGDIIFNLNEMNQVFYLIFQVLMCCGIWSGVTGFDPGIIS